MTRSLLLLLAILIAPLAACGDNLPPEETEDAGPTEVPPPPEAGGEYTIKISPSSYVCVSDGARTTATFYRVADIVPQVEGLIDLRSELQGTLYEYDRAAMPRGSDGSFHDARTDYWYIFPNEPVLLKRLEDGAADGDDLNFYHRYEVGWNLSDGTYHSECVLEADIDGQRSYERWRDGDERIGISGQWLVTKTVLADPRLPAKPRDLPENPIGVRPDPRSMPSGTIALFRDRPDGAVRVLPIGGSGLAHSAPRTSEDLPDELRVAAIVAKAKGQTEKGGGGHGPDSLLLGMPGMDMLKDGVLDQPDPPFARHEVITTISQSPDDGAVDVHDIYREFPGTLLRDLQTGAIDGYLLIIMPTFDQDGNVITVMQEMTLTGTIRSTELHLDQTWHWWVLETGEQYWFQHELYDGAPRHGPYRSDAAEILPGTYLTSFALTDTDCVLPPYVQNRLVRVLPIDGGAVWPRLTGYDYEPFVTPGPDGSFSLTFMRRGSGGIYSYTTREAKIDGRTLSLKLDIEKLDADTQAHICSLTYAVAGEKLYMTARP